MLADFDHQYQPGEWSVEELTRAFRDASGEYPLPPHDDPWYEEVQTNPIGEQLVDAVVGRARDIPDDFSNATATGYLSATRTNVSGEYRGSERRQRLSLLALAECFERDGERMEAILDYAWEICAEPTWIRPFHLTNEGHTEVNHEGFPRAGPPESNSIDLGVAKTAKVLADVVHVLGDELHPALEAHVRRSIDRRVFRPFLVRDDLHWLEPPINNWTAVCANGVLTAALVFEEDPERLARIVHKAVQAFGRYLSNFDPDGCTAEGVGYWDFGVRNYVEAAGALSAHTGGEYSLTTPPVVREVAKFPDRVELSPGRFPPFSDASEDGAVSPHAACWLGTRLELPGLVSRGRRNLNEEGIDAVPTPLFPSVLRTLQWCLDVPAERSSAAPPRQYFFDGHDWWVARDDPSAPQSLTVAAKGGHNNESHNHNDCGSFVVHYRGESLLTDLGSARYDDEYFSPQRYEYLAARSLGHSVPYVDGSEQVAGSIARNLGDPNAEATLQREHEAAVTEVHSAADRESIEYELADCYPSTAGADSVRRRITLHRGDPGRLTVSDDVAFGRSDDGAFDSVLVSFHEMDTEDGDLVVTGDSGRAVVSGEGGTLDEIERLSGAVNDKDVWRARFSPSVDGDSRIRFEIQVEPIQSS
ncbi:heparinase II/III domain-containing protein [Salinarchaeum laminariae]|uniref:heparinase II/III domain-containing protein n=1 Tax=Salinarchaeum laminariae TaxID=869888 RepID=UPI0020BD664E|nr:heparinase II/III family protein [Salinarchaeum laminariae]